jgi:hypothetical protein
MPVLCEKNIAGESVMSEKAYDSEERLNRHPILKERIASFLNIVEDSSGNYDKADEAESALIEKLRSFGNELMHGWASGKESVMTEKLIRSGNRVSGHGKKTLSANGFRRNSC